MNFQPLTVSKLILYIESFFCDERPVSVRWRVFQGAVLMYLLINTLLWWWPNATQLLGCESPFSKYYNSTNPLLAVLNLLEHDVRCNWWLPWLILQTGCTIVLWLKPGWKWLWLVFFFLTASLYNRMAPLQNAGMNLLMIALVWMPFAEPGHQQKSGISRMWQRVINRTAYVAIVFQVLLLYFVASVSKLPGESWPAGTALYYVIVNNTYGIPILYGMASEVWFVKLITWSTLVFQLTFPVLVFVKRTKGFVLMAGVLMHLSIAWLMRISDFGLLMICFYPLFMGDNLVHRFRFLAAGFNKKPEAHAATEQRY